MTNATIWSRRSCACTPSRSGHWRVGTIARQLQVHRDVVRRCWRATGGGLARPLRPTGERPVAGHPPRHGQAHGVRPGSAAAWGTGCGASGNRHSGLARPWLRERCCRLAALERGEDAPTPGRCDQASVAHCQQPPITELLHHHVSRRVTAVLEGVVHPVFEQLRQQHGTAVLQWQPRFAAQRDAARGVTPAHPPHGAADDLLGGLQIELQHAPGCLQPGQLRCVGRQVGTLVGLVDDHGGQSPPLLAREPATLVMQRRAGAQDDAQRRAVAVRGRRPQGVAQLLGLHFLLGGGSQTAAIAATSPRASAQPAQRGSQVVGGRSRRTNQHAWQREADC